MEPITIIIYHPAFAPVTTVEEAASVLQAWTETADLIERIRVTDEKKIIVEDRATCPVHILITNNPENFKSWTKSAL